MFCKNCGKELSIDEKFCSGCGQSQEAEKEVVAEEVENKESVTDDNKVGIQIESESQGNNNVGLTQSDFSEKATTKPEEQKGFVAKVVSKLLRFLKSILPGKKEGITPKEQKRNRIIAAILVVLLVFSSADDSSGNSLTVSSDNQQGALINLTLEEFSQKFNENLILVFEDTNQQGAAEIMSEEFDISDYWGDLVEPLIEYETVTGKQYTTYSAFLPAPIFVSVMDGYVSTVDISMQDADMSFFRVFSLVAVMACGDMSMSQADEIYETVMSDDAIMNNQWIYKDGILYGCSTSKLSFCIMPATQEFIDGAGDGFNYEIW